MDDRLQEPITESVCNYWTMNGGDVSPMIQWDSFKAWVQGAYISHIATLQKEGSRSLEFLETEVEGLEANYVSSPTPDRYRVWQRTLRQLSLLRVENTKKALFYSQEKVFEHGSKNGRLLAKSQNPTTHIVGIRDADGQLLVAPNLIKSAV